MSDQVSIQVKEPTRSTLMQPERGGLQHPPAGWMPTHEVLTTSGKPLDVQTRGLVEPCFEYDFSRVQVSAASGRNNVLQRQPASSSQTAEEENEEDRKKFEAARIQHQHRLREIDEHDRPHVLKSKGMTPMTRVGEDTAQIIQSTLAESRLLRPYLLSKLGPDERRGQLRITDGKFVQYHSLDDFAGAWATYTGRPANTITDQLRQEAAMVGGFYDRATKKIHLNPKATLGDALHEAMHKVSTRAIGGLFGNFLNEGVTQYFTDQVLKEQGLPAATHHRYGPQLQCANALVGIVGKDAIAAFQFAGRGGKEVRQTVIDYLGVSEVDFIQLVVKDQLCTRLRATTTPGRGSIPNQSTGISTHQVNSGLLQRAGVNSSHVSEVPLIVYDVLRSPGQPLDIETRSFMEPRFGYDFSHVRVHTGAKAVDSARRVNALAYTVGNDIVLGAGQYDTINGAGRSLLAHELTHVVQQQGLSASPANLQVGPNDDQYERQASQTEKAFATEQPLPVISSTSQLIQRQSAGSGTTAPAAAATMSLNEFRRIMDVDYGVREIRVGTYEEQVSRLSRSGSPTTGFSRDAWRPFDPSTSPWIFSSIIAAFRDFEQSIGGVPPVDRILFFDTNYEFDATLGRVTPNTSEGASFGAGEMIVYRTAMSRPKSLPIARSNPRGRYRDVPIGGRLVDPGSIPGAPVPALSQAESTRLMIVHELGHGLGEAAYRTDTNVFEDYKLAVGWLGTPPILYDIRATPVQRAIDRGITPPPAFQITREHWNDPRWVEQPVSAYMVWGGPDEDFAEAVMTYVRNRELLRSRSLHRYEFIHTRINHWLSELRQRPTGG